MNSVMKNISNYKLFFMIILISGCLVSQLLYANTDNYKNILIGDRASTMAGAFSAISDDSSGVFYNPAGLVHIPKTKYTDLY